MTLLFSPEQHEILKSGTKILLAVEPPEVLVRLVPTLADRTRVLAAAKQIAAAREMRVTSAAGTALVCPLGEFPPTAEYGFVDAPGRWDHWPSGFALTYPNDRTARGDRDRPRRHPAAAEALRARTDRADRRRRLCDAHRRRRRRRPAARLHGDLRRPRRLCDLAYRLGLQPRARWSTLGLYDREATIGMDARAFEGNFLFSLGPNNEGGGNRTTTCHIDIPLRRCTVELDGETVVRDGRVIDRPAQPA